MIDKVINPAKQEVDAFFDKYELRQWFPRHNCPDGFTFLQFFFVFLKDKNNDQTETFVTVKSEKLTIQNYFPFCREMVEGDL